MYSLGEDQERPSNQNVGYMSAGGTGNLLITDVRLNSETYIELLEVVLQDSIERLFGPDQKDAVLWDILKKRVATRNPKSKDRLKKIVAESKFTLDPCSKLVASMPKRLKEVIKSKGNVSKY